MKKLFLAAMFLLFCGVQVHAAASAVGSRGGKRSVARMIDSSGGPLNFSDDKPWKVFESTGIGVARVADESGAFPTHGMLRQICVSTGATSNFVIAYDSNTATGLSPSSNGVRLAPPIVMQTTLAQCVTVNALFTSGLVMEVREVLPQGGAYFYWRELGGYR